MVVDIENDFLKIEVASRGGELQSVKDRSGREYLWQGDSRYWEGKAPNLFPYIARLTEGKYRYHGTEYRMGIHGFVYDTELRTVWKEKDSLRMTMAATDRTKEQYPFDFVYAIDYRLEKNRLHICYEVLNRETDKKKTMYFGIGGHPGFQLPLDEGLKFEDYYLKFGDCLQCRRIGFSEDHFVNGEDEDFVLTDGCLLLRHELFDDDAIVLEGMPDSVELAGRPAGRYVRVRYPKMRYLGIWHAPGTDAPYVCIEPWSSLPAGKGVVTDLEKQEDLVALEAGAVYRNSWSIEFGYGCPLL